MKHTVKKGEYLSSIGKRYGISWERIWDLPENKELRDKRKTPNILQPGDKLVIPDKEVKKESVSTDQRSTFKRKIGKSKIKLVLMDEFGDPVSGISYQLSILGKDDIVGDIGDDGLIEAEVPLDIKSVKLVFPDIGETYDLKVGDLNPISRVSGVQQRLKNLGYYRGGVDDDYGPVTRSAVLRFQESQGIKATGVADEETRKELEQQHNGKALNCNAEDEFGEEGSVKVGPEEPVGAEEDDLPESELAGLEDIDYEEGD